MARFEHSSTQRYTIRQNSSYLGTIAFKDTPNPSNRRYLWIDYLAKEIKWSVGAVPQNPCKRLSSCFIQSISKLSTPPFSGFKIQSKSHVIIFWLPSDKETNHWISEISSLINSDENIKTNTKNAMSLINEPRETSSFELKVLSINNSQPKDPYEPEEFISKTLVNSIERLKNDEVKALKEQIASLQKKIQSMEAVRIEQDKIAWLEEEYVKAKNLGIDLNNELDKVQSEKEVLLKSSRIVKNEIGILAVYMEKVKNPMENICVPQDVVLLNNSSKIARFIEEMNTLYLYPLLDFGCDIDKFLYSMIRSVQCNGNTLTLLLENNSTVLLTGESEAVKGIKDTYEGYKSAQTRKNEKALNHFMSICEESDRQLRAIELQVDCYKKVMIDNVCSMRVANPLQVFYAAEIQALDCIHLSEVPNLSQAATSYLQVERKKLIEELLALVDSV